MSEIPRYRVLEKSFIGNTVYEADSIVEYDGLPAENLEPLCDVGRARAVECVAVRKDQLNRLVLDFQPLPCPNANAFAQLVQQTIAEAVPE